MLIFSNPIFIRGIIAIGVTIWWIVTCFITYIYGRRRGYTECMQNIRAKKRVRRKSTQYGNVRILKPVDPRKRYSEAESVRIVATHAPRFEDEDI